MEKSDIKVLLSSIYDTFTSAEKAIATFFINNVEKADLSSQGVSAKLYVSEASLSRFAQKCGFKGYREFVYEYEKYYDSNNKYSRFHYLTKKVLGTYQQLLDKSLELVNESQMERIATCLSESRCVYVYGIGSSGIAARELKLRFMRTGMLVEAVTDSHMIRMNAALADESMTIIAISLSGVTEEILSGIKLAKSRGARVLLITSNMGEFADADEVLRVAESPNLSHGTDVSPQFPILVMIDIFYTYYFNGDEFINREKHTMTVEALDTGKS